MDTVSILEWSHKVIYHEQFGQIILIYLNYDLYKSDICLLWISSVEAENKNKNDSSIIARLRLGLSSRKWKPEDPRTGWVKIAADNSPWKLPLRHIVIKEYGGESGHARSKRFAPSTLSSKRWKPSKLSLLLSKMPHSTTNICSRVFHIGFISYRQTTLETCT